ncbi:MAG: hypothetical protein U9N56_04695 [Actinomycetota bacterium]|nr:hypothetical protein [Actinomycetota bacterium]
MRERDLDLIAALVEGRLEDETEARSLIDSSSKHRAEYEAQKVAYEAVASVPTAQMTEHEKAALHRDVWSALQTEPVVAAKRSPWYFRWSYAAAAVVLVVGVGGMLTQLGGGDSDETFFEVSAGLDEGDDEGLLRDSPSAEEGAADVEDDSAAAATTEAAAGGAVASRIPPSDPTEKFFFDQAAEVRSQAYSALSTDEADSLIETHASCLQRAGLDDYMALAELDFEDAETFGLDPASLYLAAIPADIDLDDLTPVAFVELGTCTVVHTDE